MSSVQYRTVPPCSVTVSMLLLKSIIRQIMMVSTTSFIEFSHAASVCLNRKRAHKKSISHISFHLWQRASEGDAVCNESKIQRSHCGSRGWVPLFFLLSLKTAAGNQIVWVQCEAVRNGYTALPRDF